MHFGSIKNPRTKAAQILKFLSRPSQRKKWIGSYALMLATKTVAISTRISEINAQLPSGQCVVTQERSGPRWFYRYFGPFSRGTR